MLYNQSKLPIAKWYQALRIYNSRGRSYSLRHLARIHLETRRKFVRIFEFYSIDK